MALRLFHRIILIIATVLLCDASAWEWESGNTRSIPHPSESASATTIPSLLTRIADALTKSPLLTQRNVVHPSFVFVGPVAHYPWLALNDTHRWSLLDVCAAAVARFYQSMLTTSAKAADEVPSTRSALVSRRSWALCFAKEPMEEGSGIEYEQRCNAFRSRQGPIGLGVATVHEVVLRQIRHNDEGIINEGDDRSEHIRITYMEETMQIFHPDEVRDRVDFIAHATADLLDELSVDTTETATLSWSIEAAAVKFPRLLALKSSHRALRGMSLLSYEVIPTSVFARSGKQLQRASLGRPQSSLTSMCDAEAASRLPDVCGQDSSAPMDEFFVSAGKRLRIGVVSQNVWNFNGNWDQRRRAIAHDIALTVPFGVDVLMLQEVRYHSDAPDLALLQAATAAGTPEYPNGKLQALDIALGLPHAVKYFQLEGSDASNRHDGAAATVVNGDVISFSFYPSMSYLHFPHYQAPRIEMEGLMNILLGGPRVSRNRLVGNVRRLLKRSFSGDGGDDHQRAVLCSIVLFDAPDQHDGGDIRVDFCTSHFALGEDAQQRNAQETVHFLNELRQRTSFPEFEDVQSKKSKNTATRDVPRASATIFTGDLNSEPHHPVAEVFRLNQFADMWERCLPQHRRCHRNVDITPFSREHDEVAEEATAQRSSGDDDDDDDDGCGNTFNTNDAELVKRIDFIYLKVHSTADAAGKIADAHCLRFATLGSTLPASGRVSSDHLGVAAQIEFTFL